jgi:hypothetical protein
MTEQTKKATIPVVAAGAGIAGLAGGLALAHRRNGGVAHTVSKNLAEAAKSVGTLGEGMGSLAAEVRQVREGVATAGEPKRSPVEVVLQGLTRRR